MSRLRFVPIVVGALALHSAVLVAQQAPALRTLASFRGERGERFWDLNHSPNGRFVLQGTETNLRMYDVASRQSWNLAEGGAWQLTWSPRGDRVAWVRAGDGGAGSYVWAMPVDPNTGRARGPAQRVTTDRGESPSFSFDGRFLAFAAYDSGSARRLTVVPVTGGPERVLARLPSGPESGYWSVDGRSIYLGAPAENAPDRPAILKIPVDGGEPQVIRSGDWLGGMTADRRFLVAIPARGRVAPGDQAIIIDTTGREVGHVPLPVGETTLYDGILGDSALVWRTFRDLTVLEIRPIAGGSARRLPLIGESDNNPRWSPDGSRIAFQVREGHRTSLAVMNADGTNPRVYRESDVLPVLASAKWSPDSRFVAFRSPDFSRVSLLDVAAGTIRTVVEDDSIGIWMWRADGQAIIWRSRRHPAAGIYEVTLNGQSRQLLDWPVPNPSPAWQFVGDSSIFVRSDSMALLRPLSTGPARRLSSVPSGTRLVAPIVSDDRRWAAGLLADPRRSRNDQVEVFSLATGARTVLDLPFIWALNPEFLPDNNSMLISGRRRGESDITLYRVPLDGTAPRALATVAGQAGGLLAASSSPDGRWVVYSVQPEPTTQSLVLIDLRGAIPRSPSRPTRR